MMHVMQDVAVRWLRPPGGIPPYLSLVKSIMNIERIHTIHSDQYQSFGSKRHVICAHSAVSIVHAAGRNPRPLPSTTWTRLHSHFCFVPSASEVFENFSLTASSRTPLGLDDRLW